MNRFFYSFFLYLATPLILLRLLLRATRAPAYRERWGERFAWYGGNPPGTRAGRQADIVVHAVSVGEVHAAIPLINRLQHEHADLSILVTTTTPTGSARVQELLGDRVSHVYLPYDLPGAVGRFLDRWRPALVVIMETELWPNLIHHCHKRGVKTLLANARLSEKSLAGYRRVEFMVAAMLSRLDRVTAQSAQDAERLHALGLQAERLMVAGNLKYETALNTRQLDQARGDKQQLADRPVLIAASTRVAGNDVEDVRILDAFRQLLPFYPDLLLVLVPRHPERFDAVADLAGQLGLQTVRRSRTGQLHKDDQVMIGDTMGEMAYYYGLADIAFVGGSLVPTGCQNIIEPATLGLPVITGPSLFNFQAVSDQLQAAGAMTVVQDEVGLMTAVKALLDDPVLRATMGKAAYQVVRVNQGAAAKNLAVINELLAAR